jgi:hypothetical protein
MKKINYKNGFAAQGMVIIIAIAIIAGVAYYFGTKNVVAPKNDVVIDRDNSTTTDASKHIPNITEQDLKNGWYYGTSNQKKIGTPSDWIHSGDKTKSAMWSAPSLTKTQPSLTILSPNGGENWVKGTTKTIRWINPSTQTVSGAGGPQDEIAIFINSQPADTAPLLKTVVTGINKNATSYDWTVGSNAENAVLNGSYYIKICRKTFTCDWSDTSFTITN